jgi:hypothetical protein
MTLLQATHEVESHDFAAGLGVANNLEMLYGAMASQQAVRDLVALCVNRDDAYRLVSRAVALVKEQDDVNYRNPNDAAIATYLWVLAQTQPYLAQLLAASVLNAPRFWWARKVGLDLVRRQAVVPQSTTRIASEGEWQVSGSTPRELLVISEPAECVVISGKFVEVRDVKANSAETQSEAPYSTANSSAQEIVVSR